MMQFTAPKTLSAHYRLTTPLFLGGENQHADDKQFRNASFKGALRFWWRALNWGKMIKEAQGDQNEALKRLHDEEGMIFGLASDGKDSRQSAFTLHSTLDKVTRQDKHTELGAVSYLLGQGLYHFKNGVLRPCLEGGHVDIRLEFKPQTTVTQIASVEQALIALGLFGGLGSRARRGLGSLSLEEVTGGDGQARRFTTMDAIRSFIAGLDFSAPGLPPYSAFSQATRIDLSLQGDSALRTLAAVNTEMQLYRSFGQNGRVGHQPARRNFVDDHDNVLAATQRQPLNALPRRAVFGLPHNYFFSGTKAKVDINPSGEGRRASPLLIHIHALEGGQFAAIQTLLPAVFLGPDMTVDIKTNSPQTLRNTDVDYIVIRNYLDGFANRKTLRTEHRD